MGCAPITEPYRVDIVDKNGVKIFYLCDHGVRKRRYKAGTMDGNGLRSGFSQFGEICAFSQSEGFIHIL